MRVAKPKPALIDAATGQPVDPDGGVPKDILDTAAACKKMVGQRSLWAAGVAVVPIPGLDVAADIALLMRLINTINERFGLTQAQVEALSPSKRALAFKAITSVGSSVIGSALTRSAIVALLKLVAGRHATKQVTKYVPLAGQALSAVLAYSAMRAVLNKHVDDCVRVKTQLLLLA
jgi:uncharacterized protein (DUF697 family)